MKAPKPRNPMARELARNPLFRTKIAKSAAEIQKKRDKWDRGRKHKGSVNTDPFSLNKKVFLTEA